MKKTIVYVISILILICILWIILVKQPLLFNTKISNEILEVVKSDSNKLEDHVKILSSHERFSDEGLERASKYIIEGLKENWITEEQITIQDYTVWKREYKNIIVSIRWKSLRKTDYKWTPKKYVIWAHYDSHEELPAADDNASWVAWLLEIARILNNQNIGHKKIELVFYSTEEMPHFRDWTMWSYFHAQSNQDTELAIILEMIWYFSDEKWSQSFPIDGMKYLYSDIGNYIALVSNFSNFWSIRKVKWLFQSYLWDNSSIWVESMNAPSTLVPQVSFSDHKSYWKFWIPAIMVTDTAFLRNKNYHTHQDTYEKLDYKKMKEVVDAVVVTVLSL